MIGAVPLTVIDLVDAVADDLNPIATGLDPDYLDWRYARPDLLSADHAPWLAVWSPITDHDLLTTSGEYLYSDTIEVEWAVPLGQEVDEGGQNTPQAVKAAILAAAPILARMRSYAGGLPGLGNQFAGILAQTTRDESEGLVWRQTSRFVVVSAAQE